MKKCSFWFYWLYPLVSCFFLFVLLRTVLGHRAEILILICFPLSWDIPYCSSCFLVFMYNLQSLPWSYEGHVISEGIAIKHFDLFEKMTDSKFGSILGWEGWLNSARRDFGCPPPNLASTTSQHTMKVSVPLVLNYLVLSFSTLTFRQF